MTSGTMTILAFSCYLLSSIGFGAMMFLRSKPSPNSSSVLSFAISRYARPLLWLGILLQFISIGLWCVSTHNSPFASEYGTLSTAAWMIAITFSIVDFRRKLPVVGAAALPIALVLLGVGMVHLKDPLSKSTALAGQIVTLHVMAILLSFGLFAVAFGCAALYLLQNRLLKEHHVRGLFRHIPPLETLDTVSFHAVSFALPMLTIGLIVGMVHVFAGDVPKTPREWFLDQHTIISLATWVIYVFYQCARLITGWRGVRLQYILVAGMAATLTLFAIPTNTHHFQ